MRQPCAENLLKSLGELRGTTAAADAGRNSFSEVFGDCIFVLGPQIFLDTREGSGEEMNPGHFTCKTKYKEGISSFLDDSRDWMHMKEMTESR